MSVWTFAGGCLSLGADSGVVIIPIDTSVIRRLHAYILGSGAHRVPPCAARLSQLAGLSRLAHIPDRRAAVQVGACCGARRSAWLCPPLVRNTVNLGGSRACVPDWPTHLSMPSCSGLTLRHGARPGGFHPPSHCCDSRRRCRTCGAGLSVAFGIKDVVRAHDAMISTIVFEFAVGHLSIIRSVHHDSRVCTVVEVSHCRPRPRVHQAGATPGMLMVFRPGGALSWCCTLDFLG